jgi:hypothetical protein
MDPVSAIGAGIGGITSLVGGLIGSNASSNAAATQQKNAQQVSGLLQNATQGGQAGVTNAIGAANPLIAAGTQQASQAIGGGIQGANATLAGIYGQQTQNLDPYLATGQTGLSMLNQAVAPGGSLAGQFSAPTAAEAEATPGYQFSLNQGMQALQRSAAAGGSLQGGGTLKAITQYAQGLADTNYQNVYNNALNTFGTNRNATLQNLSALTSQGQYGTSQFNQAAENAGNQQAGNTMQGNMTLAGLYNQGAQAQAGNLTQGAQFNANLGLQGTNLQGQALTGGANATAAGQVGSANAWNSALGGVGNAAQYASLSNLLGSAYQGNQSAPSGFLGYNSATPWGSVGPSTPPALTQPSFSNTNPLGLQPQPPAYQPNY